jgi:hypothetical protein
MNEQRLAAYRHQLVSANLAEFGDTAEALNWISPGRAMAVQTERGKRLQSMGQHLHLAFKGTKPHIGPLSPGCRICGEGDWSCLFVNGKCNCRCFYCPSSQAEIGVPTTNRVPFNRSADPIALTSRRVGNILTAETDHKQSMLGRTPCKKMPGYT